MDASCEFRVLGPLEAVVEGRTVHLASGKQRIVLTALLLRANRTVTIDALIDALWDGVAPADARGTVQKYVMRLRRLIDDAGGRGEVIRTEPEGYRIAVPRRQLDLERFAALCADAGRASSAGDVPTEAALLSEALRLWRSVPPLADVPSPALHRHEVPELVERYLQTVDRRIRADLRLGRHDALVGELTVLVRRYPERERFWAHRMRALHGAGRRSEALAVYREVAALLAEEFGIDPGPELRAAHREVLDDGADTAAGFPARTQQARPVPRQLPRPTACFVGRQAELARIATALDGTDPHGTGAPVVVSGLPGTGKTALAVHAAHLVAARFPDGQLFAELRAHAPGPPAAVADVVDRFLVALGARADDAPAHEHDKVMAYRSLVAGRRMVVVLDDAASAEQVRLLLPGSPGCAAVITSRHELGGLVVAPGARRVALDVFAPAEARDLLVHLLGARRVADDPAAVDALARRCGGLPLALRVAAAQLALRPDLPVAGYVGELLAEDVLAALRVEGDASSDVATAIGRSYRCLRGEHRRLLRLVSLVAGAELTIPVTAAAAGIDPSAALAGLEALAASGLLQRGPTSGHRLHDLVREYAARRCEREDTDVDRAAARERVTELRLGPGGEGCVASVHRHPRCAM